MKWKIISLIFVLMICLPMVLSETSFFVKKDQPYDIKFACDVDGFLCPSTTSCNITISYVLNSTIIIDKNETSNLNNGYFNITLNETKNSASGEYSACVYCSNNNLNETSCFTYEVNPTGIRPSGERTESITRSIYFIFGIGILLFIAFLFVRTSQPVKWTFFILAFIFFLIGLNLVFVGIQDEVVNPNIESFFDSFTAISFLLYWFFGGLLIIMWLFTFLNTWLYKKNIKKAQQFEY